MKDVTVEQWQQANKIYKDLLDLTVGDAMQQLHNMDDLTDGVKSLVLSLINSGDHSSEFFDQEISASFEAQNWQDLKLSIGDELGEYQITAELGHGGMASVYQAQRKDEVTQKPVAIKVFNRTQLTPILLNRFAVEQDILSGLSHPNIVNMHHGGTSETGVPYMIMELIDGAQDVDKFVESQDLNLKQKVGLVIKAAQAISYAHNNLIVHRDIKPSNLLVDKRGGLKVVDFGIAKMMTKEDAPQKTTIMALTPSFAAPEQINSEVISVSTDVFSLAAVCLALIIEDLPLPADRLMKSCAGDEVHIWQLLKSKVKDGDLQNILNKALQQKPENRYRNMESFADDLSAWLENKPVTATQSSWFYRLGKFARRRSALFASLITLFLMLSVSLGVFSWQYKQTKIEAAKAVQVKNFMLQVFSYADPNEHIAEKLSAFDLLSLAENEIQFQQFTDKNVQADILSAIGTAYSNLGSWDKGYEILEKVVQINPNDVSANLKLAQIHLDKSEPELASTIIQEIERNHDFTQDQQTIEFADLMMLKALESIYKENISASITLAQKAKDTYSKLNNYNGVLKASRVIAERYVNDSNTERGLQEASKTLTEMEDKVSSVNTEVMRLKTTQIYLHIQLAQYDEAKLKLGSLIQNIKDILGDKHPALIDALVQRASVLRNTGDMPGANKDAEESYEIAVEVYGEKSQMAQQSLAMLAQNKFATGERDVALDLIKQVVDISIHNYGESHRMTLEAKGEYANYLGANGLVNEAIEVARYVYDMNLKANGANDYKSIFAANVLLKLLAMQAELKDEILQMAIDNNQRAEEQLGQTHPQTAYSYFVLGTMYAKFEKYDEANKALISLIESGTVKQDNPRFLALSQAISDNYLAAGNRLKALDYAKQGWLASENIMGSGVARTIQLRLKMMGLISDKEEYKNHLDSILLMIESGKITDESMIEKIKDL